MGRLKACPDCRWVFYDNSRNGSKRWCGMYAGEEGGRACGTIAKVKITGRREKGDRVIMSNLYYGEENWMGNVEYEGYTNVSFK